MITYPNVKINLGLSVLRRREDGFHDLETLFVPYYGLHDTLEINKADEFSIELIGADWPAEKDLTAKAYELLRQEYSIGPVSIRLIKGSPVGAGLGGGSADAAFALRMMSELYQLGLSDAELAALASKLGSDCAFFVYNKPMIGEGRGEILTPFDLNLEGYKIEVAVPEGVSVSTKEAYAGITPRERMAAAPAFALRDALARPVEEWKDCLVNDFEATVFEVHPGLAAMKKSLYESGAVYAAMSGSGSALFGIYKI